MKRRPAPGAPFAAIRLASSAEAASLCLRLASLSASSCALPPEPRATSALPNCRRPSSRPDPGADGGDLLRCLVDLEPEDFLRLRTARRSLGSSRLRCRLLLCRLPPESPLLAELDLLRWRRLLLLLRCLLLLCRLLLRCRSLDADLELQTFFFGRKRGEPRLLRPMLIYKHVCAMQAPTWSGSGCETATPKVIDPWRPPRQRGQGRQGPAPPWPPPPPPWQLD